MAKSPNNIVEVGPALQYPYYSQARALTLAEAVKNLGGINTDIQKSSIAREMNLEDTSPTLMGILGAAKLYDMVQGRGAFRLTETATMYFHPKTENERRIATLKMLKGPPLYSALIDRFDGQKLPPTDSLVNILHLDYRIAESWQMRVATQFPSALREAGVLDAGGTIRWKAAMHEATGSIAAVPTVVTPIYGAASESNRKMASERAENDRSVAAASDVDVWSFKIGDQTVRLETSRELSVTAWEKLNQYIQVLKPVGTVEGATNK